MTGSEQLRETALGRWVLRAEEVVEDGLLEGLFRWQTHPLVSVGDLARIPRAEVLGGSKEQQLQVVEVCARAGWLEKECGQREVKVRLTSAGLVLVANTPRVRETLR